MLMMDHKSDIEHILHDLEQIENSKFDQRLDVSTIEHSRRMAHEVSEELRVLLQTLEVEELANQSRLPDPKKIEDMCMLSYYMSFYNWEDLIGRVKSIEEASIRCAEKLDCNALSLMNMKVMYDDYTYSMENGWSGIRELPEDMMFVMEICDNMTNREVLMACQCILGMGH